MSSGQHNAPAFLLLVRHTGDRVDTDGHPATVTWELAAVVDNGSTTAVVVAFEVVVALDVVVAAAVVVVAASVVVVVSSPTADEREVFVNPSQALSHARRRLNRLALPPHPEYANLTQTSSSAMYVY